MDLAASMSNSVDPDQKAQSDLSMSNSVDPDQTAPDLGPHC